MEIEGCTANWIYHYTSRDTAIEKILEPQQLKFSPLEKTNDPRESKAWDLVLSSRPPALSNDVVFGILQLSNKVKSCSKLLCFSQDDPYRVKEFPGSLSSYGCFRPRMWAQYGENHSGVCIALDRIVLNETIVTHLGSKGKIHEGSVDYVEDDSGIDAALHVDADVARQDGIETAVERHLDRFHKQLFLQKDADWKGEIEYRWIVRTNDTEPEYVPIKESIRAVFLGIEFPPVYKKLIMDLTSCMAVPVYQIRWSYGVACIERSTNKI